MTTRAILLLSAFLLLGGCKQDVESISLPEFIQGWTQDQRSDEQVIWDGLVGNWYGSLVREDGSRHQWLNRHYADGTYEVDFQTVSTNGKVSFSRETGQWGAAGGIYFTIFRGWLYGDEFEPSDPSDAFNYDAYRMLKLQSDLVIYESLKTKTRYEARRVPEGFRIPAPDEETGI